jgi:hypothetical protein
MKIPFLRIIPERYPPSGHLPVTGQGQSRMYRWNRFIAVFVSGIYMPCFYQYIQIFYS